MITKKDAIAIGKAICSTARSISESDRSTDRNLVHMGRGTCIMAMDSIWHDTLPMKTRELFNFRRETFFQECGWPE